jgi:hypothetical protein
MRSRLHSLFSFPNPVNEVAARAVAAGVLVMATLAIVLEIPWLLVPLVYGFWARVLTGPSLSPLGQLATRVVAPVLPFEPRLTPGPPKRFAQAMGVAMSTAALIVWVSAGWGTARWVLVPLNAAALLEAGFGLCIGCRIFGALMRRGIIPERVCLECAEVGRRHPTLAGRGAA